VNHLKIILSPSKTAEYQLSPYLTGTKILYPKQTKKLVATIRKLSQKDLGKALNIKGDILKQTHLYYQQFHLSQRFHAFVSFNGLVFKQLEKDLYKEQEYSYINTHLVILDALYGILEPSTLITPYRLDMKAKLGFSLYNYWEIDDYFNEEPILNLASNEFSEMIHKPVITVQFLQKKKDTYIQQATYSKMARGSLLNYLIRNQIQNIEEVKGFKEDGYIYNSERSTEDTIVFTR